MSNYDASSSRRGRRTRSPEKKRKHILKAGGLTALFYAVSGFCAGATYPVMKGIHKLSSSLGNDTAYDLVLMGSATPTLGVCALSSYWAFKMTERYKVEPLVKIIPGIVSFSFAAMLGANVASEKVSNSEFFSTQGNKQGEWQRRAQEVRELEYYNPGSSN